MFDDRENALQSILFDLFSTLFEISCSEMVSFEKN